MTGIILFHDSFEKNDDEFISPLEEKNMVFDF